ncbi:MAG: hypothetical protein AAGA80_17860, partial [Cyanobacteria bacterium P01_F01_bin.143]
MDNFDFSLNRWNWRGLTPELAQALSEIGNRFSSDRNITIAGRNNIEDVLDTILDNSQLDSKFIIALGNIPSNAIDGIPNQTSIVSEIFPDYASYEGHQKAVDFLHILTGLPKNLISSEWPGLGFTGTEDEGIAQGVGVAANFPAFLNETVIHDVLVTLSEDLSSFGLGGIDGDVYGTTNKVISALYIALDSLTLNLTKALRTGDLSVLIPEEEEFLDFIGFNKAPEENIALFNTVTNLGKTGSTIGAKLAIFLEDEALANQLITQAAASTLGGFIGDKIVYDNFTIKEGFPSLKIRDLYTRFYGEYFRTLINLGTSAINDALFEAFELEDPLSQITVSAIGSAFFYNTYGSLVNEVFGSDFPVQYLGLDPRRDYTLSLAAIKGDIIQNLYGGIQNFAGSQLFLLLDEVWSDANLSNLGSSIGGTIGSLVLPGIGTLVGQVVGGFVWDLIDNPEAFYRVDLNFDNNSFEYRFAFEDDDGEVAIAEQMAQSASDTLNLIVGMIGGTAISTESYLYGLKEDQFQYRNQNIVSFDDFESAITEGIVSQIKTVEIDGGDQYMKYLVAIPEYFPSLELLFEDLGVAQEYSNHKDDPFLYGQTILNIEDEDAKDYLLEDWNRILGRVRELGLDNAPFNDGGEFISGTRSNDNLDGNIGNDFLYGSKGNDIINGGDGNDTIEGIEGRD